MSTPKLPDTALMWSMRRLNSGITEYFTTEEDAKIAAFHAGDLEPVSIRPPRYSETSEY